MAHPIPLPTVGIGGEVFDNTALNLLLPMHVQLDKAGKIKHVGPTFAKLLENKPFIKGMSLFEYVQFTHPKNIYSNRDLAAHIGVPLVARINAQTIFDLKAVVVPMPGNDGAIVNFAFGTSLKDAVAHWHLNGKDFSPADPTVEMLYVIEVQSALLEESRNLNNRLNGQWEEAEEKAYTDPLTGLSNRRALERYIKRLHRRRDAKNFAVFLIDLDHFKLVNDTLGHAAGDKVLQEVADILLNETRPTDIVVRTGGDEFVLVFENAENKDQTEAIANRIIQRIERPIRWENQSCHVGASIGIVMCHGKSAESVDHYLQAGDEALYASKKGRSWAVSLCRVA